MKYIPIMISILLGLAVIFLVIDNKKANDSVTSYKEQVKTYQNKNDSLNKRNDSIEYELAEIHIQFNNVSYINQLLSEQYKNSQHEIDSLKKLRNYITKIDSSVYMLNCKQLSDSLSIPSF